MDTPLVSMIVPVYNAQERIGRCLHSICRQKYKNLEILVVNDGSKDDSWSVIQQFQQKDSRIHAINKENSGVSHTRNMALEQAKGTYIQFVDSDDYLDENATSLLVEKALAWHADLVISHFCHVANDKTSVYGFIHHDEASLSQKEFLLGFMRWPASYYYGVMWNKLYRRALIEENQIRFDTEMSWSEDFLFNLEYYKKAQIFIALHTPVYYYVENQKSIVHTQVDPAAVVKMKASMFPYYKKLFEDLNLYQGHKAQIHKYLVAMAEHI